MSKLLINENPLIVLPSLAVAVGLNQALFLQQVHYWLQTSRTTHDGKKWTYNTLEEWHKQFPFFSKSTINRTISDLVESGLLIVSKLSENKHDRTNYYTIDYVKLEQSTYQNDKIDCVNFDSKSEKMDCVKMTKSNNSNWHNVTETSTKTTKQTNTREVEKNEQAIIDNLTSDPKNFVMPFDWQPNKQEFNAYCVHLGVDHKKLTSEILSKFIAEARSNQQKHNESKWCKFLAAYLKKWADNPQFAQQPKQPNQHIYRPTNGSNQFEQPLAYEVPNKIKVEERSTGESDEVRARMARSLDGLLGAA